MAYSLKYRYESTSQTYTVVGNQDVQFDDWVVIPSMYNDGTNGRHPVTRIGNVAFLNCARLKRITIPDSITSIGEWAFAQCNNLRSIKIPDSVISIEDRAFYDSQVLKSVIIGKGVTSIAREAFDSNSNLKQLIFFPSTPPTLGSNAIPNSIPVIYVRQSSEEEYKAATNWTALASKIVSDNLYLSFVQFNQKNKDYIDGLLYDFGLTEGELPYSIVQRRFKSDGSVVTTEAYQLGTAAFGGNTVAGDPDGTAGDFSFAFAANEDNKAIPRASAAFGRYNTAHNIGEFVCGDYADNNRNPQTIFAVGTGLSDTDRKTGFEVRKDGYAYVNGKAIATEKMVQDTAVHKEGVSYILYGNEADGKAAAIPYRFNKNDILSASFPLMFQPMINGRIYVREPTDDYHAVNKKYVDDVKEDQANFNLTNGTGQGSIIQKNVKSSSGDPYNNVASGSASIALGKNTQALGNTDVVIGQNNTANASGSFVGGINCSNTDNSNYSFVFGDSVINKYATKSIIAGSDIENSEGNSIILGSDIINPLKNSFLIGRGLRSQNYISPYNDNAEYGITILGRYNKRATQGEDVEGTSFIIGNGTSDKNRSNAIKLSDVKGLECFIEPKTDYGVVRKVELKTKLNKPNNLQVESVVTIFPDGTEGTTPVSRFATTTTTPVTIPWTNLKTNEGILDQVRTVINGLYEHSLYLRFIYNSWNAEAFVTLLSNSETEVTDYAGITNILGTTFYHEASGIITNPVGGENEYAVGHIQNISHNGLKVLIPN